MEAFMEELQHLKIQLEDIKSAPHNFHSDNVIGTGGFGKVYKGEICHSKGQSMVAFKRLDSSCGQGHPEFLKEILMLSGYTHENLITLLGFCDEEGEKILVYEHAFHGSLDRYLSSTSLTWRKHLKICLAAAKGLCYLHDPKGTQQRVIHRDMKSSNILLDENWNAKISDMGLSKIGPANQQHTFLATNVVGTFGYIDPLYMETYSLTKESDVYSFGLVLFEVLCGSLCYEYKNGDFQSLVPIWKKSYEAQQLDEIIFGNMKQHMYPSSLETFSEIAYRRLKRSREERPTMSDVVEKLGIALEFVETSEEEVEVDEEVEVEAEAEMDYEELSKRVVPAPLVFGSKEELKMLLSRGVLVNEGKTWFSLNKEGDHCEMISAIECLSKCGSDYLPKFGGNKTRFAVENRRIYYRYCYAFETHARPQFLSPHTRYVVNLVFHCYKRDNEHLHINYQVAGEEMRSCAYIVEDKDKWSMAELCQFTTGKNTTADLRITFKSPNQRTLQVEGIDFQPLERVEHDEVLKDEEVDIETISDSDTYWEKKLPSDYQDIIKWSKNSMEWTTNKELYSIFCKGFPVDNHERPVLHDLPYFGEEWFCLDQNGKKCHLIPAREALEKSEWNWESFPGSRFEEVAFNPQRSFKVYCRSEKLSSQTRYATYLVYKFTENHSGFETPTKVSEKEDYNKMRRRRQPWYIYLHTPQTSVTRGKVYHNKYVPHQRNDYGWVEVQVWEFQTETTTQWIRSDLELTLPNSKLHKGLIVHGLEFRPI